MPLFDFVCKECHHRFEELVSPGDTPACPRCSGTQVDRQLPVFAVGGGQPGERLPAGGPCGSCGDPRGPGACSLD